MCVCLIILNKRLFKVCSKLEATVNRCSWAYHVSVKVNVEISAIAFFMLSSEVPVSAVEKQKKYSLIRQIVLVYQTLSESGGSLFH